MSRALVDTSALIGSESGRPLDVDRIPDEVAVSVITIGELHAGVLAAKDLASRDLRLRVELREAGHSMPVNDSWIAATALALGVAVVTRDDDDDGVPGLEVVNV
jgi:predicted nucleic acid-binding protein